MAQATLGWHEVFTLLVLADPGTAEYEAHLEEARRILDARERDERWDVALAHCALRIKAERERDEARTALQAFWATWDEYNHINDECGGSCVVERRVVCSDFAAAVEMVLARAVLASQTGQLAFGGSLFIRAPERGESWAAYLGVIAFEGDKPSAAVYLTASECRYIAQWLDEMAGVDDALAASQPEQDDA